MTTRKCICKEAQYEWDWAEDHWDRHDPSDFINARFAAFEETEKQLIWALKELKKLNSSALVIQADLFNMEMLNE